MGFAIAGAVGVAGLAGAYLGSNASQNAASTQANAANQASALQYQEFLQQQQNEAPYLAAGTQALGTLQADLPSLSQKFTMADFQSDPGYQFTLQQGQQAINNSSAARGLVDSTGTMKDLSTFNQNAASSQYQNAYNNYVQNQNQTYNQLAGIAGIGQVATGQSNQSSQVAGSQIGGNINSAGNAAAAGQVGTANAWNGAIGTASNAGMGAWMTSQINAQRGVGYGGGSVNATNGQLDTNNAYLDNSMSGFQMPSNPYGLDG